MTGVQRFEADRLAIQQWKAAGEGRELILPDHVDLVTWLLAQLEAKKEEVKRHADWVTWLMEQLDAKNAEIARLREQLKP